MEFEYECGWWGTECIVWGEPVMSWWTQKYELPAVVECWWRGRDFTT